MKTILSVLFVLFSWVTWGAGSVFLLHIESEYIDGKPIPLTSEQLIFGSLLAPIPAILCIPASFAVLSVFIKNHNKCIMHCEEK